jgi:hypothetical protein
MQQEGWPRRIYEAPVLFKRTYCEKIGQKNQKNYTIHINSQHFAHPGAPVARLLLVPSPILGCDSMSF